MPKVTSQSNHFTPESSTRYTPPMATLYMLEGPVGAGKSTLAAKLAAVHMAPHLNLDDWMVTLFRPDRPATDFISWYMDRKSRCIEQIWTTTQSLLAVDVSVVLELGLVRYADRQPFYQRLDDSGVEAKIFVLDVPREERWRRVQLRNRTKGPTYRMEVTEQVFEIADDAWEMPDDLEVEIRGITIIRE